MSDDKNFGELYDLVTDPDKTRNLYRDKACAGVAYEALCRLLEWLIGTARIATMSPVSNRGRYLGITYATADDGEEANTAGLAQQARSGTKHYL